MTSEPSISAVISDAQADETKPPQDFPGRTEILTPDGPADGFGVSLHILQTADGGDDLFLLEIQDVEVAVIYTAEVWIFVPAEACVSSLAFVMVGFPAESYNSIDLKLRNAWQRLHVACRIPTGHTRALPGLIVRGARGSVIFSAGWCFRRQTSTRLHASSTHRRNYTVRPLAEIRRLGAITSLGRPIISVSRCLADVDVPIPALSFGQLTPPETPYFEGPAGTWNAPSYSIRNSDLFTLRQAVIHGEQGIITVGDSIVEESLYHADPARAGFQQAGERQYRLDDQDPDLELDVAAYALCGYVGNRNYGHWWADVVPALLVPPYGRAFAGAQLLMPKLRQPYQTQTLALFPEARQRAVFVGEHSRVLCRELRFVPRITASDHAPHPARLALIDMIKDRAGYRGESGRRIYISRKDTAARPLLNEDDVIALLEKYGFETLVLSSMRLTEQIKTFASASHVVGAHGAGLINVMFCAPGTVLCEIHQQSFVNWSIRLMAAVSRMRYGCILGVDVDGDAPTHAREWNIDLGQLAAVLQAPGFGLPFPPDPQVVSA